MKRPTPINKERILGENDFIVSKTDLKGIITYANRIFIDMAEYTEDELLGAPHNILRHEDMPRAVFKLLWDTVASGKEIFAFVINKTKNGNAYWVYANISPSFDPNGKIVGYYSVRRMANPKAIEKIKPIYNQMLKAEKAEGIEASSKILKDILSEKGVEYNELIISLQE